MRTCRKTALKRPTCSFSTNICQTVRPGRHLHTTYYYSLTYLLSDARVRGRKVGGGEGGVGAAVARLPGVELLAENTEISQTISVTSERVPEGSFKYLVAVPIPAVETATAGLVSGVEGRGVVAAGEARGQVDILSWGTTHVSWETF